MPTRDRIAHLALQAIEIAVAVGLLGLSLLAAFSYALRSTLPVVDDVNRHGTHVRDLVDETVRLGAAAGSQREVGIAAIPGPVPAELGSLERLVAASRASKQIRTQLDRVLPLRDELWRGQLGAVGKVTERFWLERQAVLCQPHRPPPLAPVRGDPVDLALYLSAITAYGSELWPIYERCLEPKSVVIDESLLHFQVDRWDRFEGNPAPALEKIDELADANVATHPRIFVLGHTDETGSTAHNDFLSYKRARYIANQLRAHLAKRGLREGSVRDYELYPIGMGENQKLVRAQGETDVEYLTRCRRIELSFRARDASR